MKKILGIGEILWDLLPGGKQLGGAPANFAFHARQLGLDAGIVSAVGRDLDGKEILDRILQYGIRCFISVNDKPTGTVSVSLDQQGIPHYLIHENVAWDFADTVSDALDWAGQCEAICFGSLAQRSPVTRETIHAMLKEAPSSCLKIFDINLRQQFYNKEIIEESLREANILKINDEELRTLGEMFGLGKEEEIIAEKALRQFRLDYLALTKGASGSWMFSVTDASWLDTPNVQVADTVGAGDSFTAALVKGILAGKKLSEVHKLAVEVSAYVCTQKGATPDLPEKFKH